MGADEEIGQNAGPDSTCGAISLEGFTGEE